MEKIKVGIAGCGEVAGFGDEPGKKGVVSHAKAIHLHPGFELTGCFDVDGEKAKQFATRWNCKKIYADSKNLMDSSDIDLLVVASSTDSHYELISRALSSSAQIIVCEKPLVTSLRQLEEVKSMVRSSGKTFIVNLIRRFDPGHRKLAGIISSGELDNPLYFSGYFTKGLLHNGCHAVDLLYFFFGKEMSISSARFEKNGYDATGVFECMLKEGTKGTLCALGTMNYALFEMEIIFMKGKISIQKGGQDIKLYKTVQSEFFKGVSQLEFDRSIETDLQNGFYHLYDAIFKDSEHWDKLFADACNGTHDILNFVEK